MSVDEFEAEPIALHPNPASDFISVESNLTIDSYEVYDILGKKVISSKLVNNTIDIQALKSGMYILNFILTTENQQANYKAIIAIK